MNEEIEMFFENSAGPSYLESIIKTRRLLVDVDLISKIDELIGLEIDLAIIGAKKALSEVKKESGKVVSIK